MKRILFICGSLDYPNGICVKAVVEEAARRGMLIDVICSSSKPIQNEKGIDYHQVKCNYFEGLLNDKGRISTFQYAVRMLLSRIRALMLIPVWPHYGPIYYRNLKKKATELLVERSYDAVVGVYNHYECLMVANDIKKAHPKTKLVAYFLDCLSGGVTPRYFSKRTAYRKGLKAEKRVLQNADSVIIMNSHEKHDRTAWKDAAWKNKVTVLDIPLYQPMNIQSTTESQKQVRMLYMGALQRNLKNPRYFLELLQKGGFENLTVSFVGPSDCKEIISEFENKTNATIVQLGSVPHDKALSMECAADILLNIGSKNIRQIPCKIFEYMSTGKPIVSIAPSPEEPSNYYLSVYPKALIVYENASVEDNIANIKKFINHLSDVADYGSKFDERLFICKPEAFVKVIDQLIE